MREDAAVIRKQYLLGKPVGKANVAIAEVHLKGDTVFCTGATSRGGKKSPIPDIPKPKSAGGQFEPAIDTRTQRLMDTDAEYKVLSEIAATLEKIAVDLKMSYDRLEGNLYLYTELQPCESCNDVLTQFEQKFSGIKTDVFWDYPYTP